MTAAPQPDTEVVTGTITGIVAKPGDKWQVLVDVGRQNPRGLWTKDASLVQQLSLMIGQATSFLCGVSTWTNQQNQPVRSLWINGVGQGAAVPQAAMPQQPVAPPPVAPQPLPVQPPTIVQPMVQPMQPVAQLASQAARLSDEERESRIMRQTATKVASILISHVPAEQRTLDNVLSLSEKLMGYYRSGMNGNPGDGTVPQVAPDEYGTPPHTDDDIPF